MERIYTTQIGEHVGEQVRLAGWLHTLRRMGGINFLVLRDVRGTAQIVVDTPEALAALDGLLPETVLAIEGTVVAEPQAPGGMEVRSPIIEVLSPVREAAPIGLNKPALKTSLPVFLDHAVIGLRHPQKRALFRLSAGIMAGYRATLNGLGFIQIRTPKLVAAATEGGRTFSPWSTSSGRLSGPEPAILQADHGRRLRAGLRDRPGLPRRAARHNPSHQRVRQPRPGDGLRPRPSGRHGGADADCRGGSSAI